MKNRRKQDKSILIWQYIIGSGVLLTVLAFSLLNIFNLSMEPYQSAKSKTIDLAHKYAGVSRIDSFAIYNGKKSYYSLLGETNQKRQDFSGVIYEKLIYSVDLKDKIIIPDWRFHYSGVVNNKPKDNTKRSEKSENVKKFKEEAIKNPGKEFRFHVTK